MFGKKTTSVGHRQPYPHGKEAGIHVARQFPAQNWVRASPSCHGERCIQEHPSGDLSYLIFVGSDKDISGDTWGRFEFEALQRIIQPSSCLRDAYITTLKIAAKMRRHQVTRDLLNILTTSGSLTTTLSRRSRVSGLTRSKEKETRRESYLNVVNTKMKIGQDPDDFFVLDKYRDLLDIPSLKRHLRYSMLIQANLFW